MTALAARGPAGEDRHSTFASLKIPNYRRYFWGQLVSVSGTWMQAMAQQWLVLKELNGGGSALGWVSACQALPILLFGLRAGVLADRLDRRKILIGTQIWLGSVAAIQAVLVLSGSVQLWMVMVLGFALGMGNAVDLPTRSAFVNELVGTESITNAVGLNSMVQNGARVIGPAIGAALIKLVGTGWCFAFNSVSFIAVVFALMRMNTATLHPYQRAPRAKGQVREGLVYAWGVERLRWTLVVIGIVGLFTLNFQVALPLLAKNVYNGDEGAVGLLSAALGVGAVLCALRLARLRAPTPRLVVGAALLLGGSLVAVSMAPTILIGAMLTVVVGAGFMGFLVLCNTTLQLNSEPARRGRLMATNTVLTAGTTPIGAPLIGLLADAFSPRAAVAFMGAAALVAAGVYWAALVRPAGSAALARA